MTTHPHLPHPRLADRAAGGPVKTSDLHRRDSAVARFNTAVAVAVTRIVGSMWCAYAFAAFDCISLPQAIHSGTSAIVSWIAQTFLQLVLLSVIMVGQNVQAAAADARAASTWADVEAILHNQQQVLTQLAALTAAAPEPEPPRP